jgi:DnaJ domain
MPVGTAQSRLRMMESLEARPDLTVILDSSGSPGSRLQARFVGYTGDVMKIQTNVALGKDLLVSVAGQVDTGTGISPVLGQYRVCWSRIAGIGKYHAELAMETPIESDHEDRAAPADSSHGSSTLDFEEADYYEILQVSRHADTDTVHRVFHILAQRYHPDNPETGNDPLFRKLVDAHAVLSHAERRAAYDVRLTSSDKVRLKIFDSLASTQGVQAEIRKRKGVLRLLYTKRLTDPHQPSMRVREFAEMLGCPIEHLEFSLWFLRERKQIVRADNNQFEITGNGVEAFEADESNYSKKAYLTLPAPAQATA